MFSSITISLTSQFLIACSVAGEPYDAWVAEPAPALNALPATTGTSLTAEELAAIAKSSPTPPYTGFTAGVRAPDGAIWIGTPQGLLYRSGDGAPWRVFHSRHWLPDREVRGVALASDGSVLVETPKGIGRLAKRRTTLDEKMAEIRRRLRQYHIREGLIGEIQLKEPGRVDAGWSLSSSDNDGLWTSLYVAAEAYRYGVTGDEEAKRNARQSLDALLFLEKVTGISGFAARSIWPAGEGVDANKMFGGEWHLSADKRWWWKGDTSSDELDGHYFAYAVYYDLCADEREKEEIRAVVARITDHIIDHGYYYVGPPGRPTTWGVWAPEKLNRDLKWILDRGLNSLEILSHLKVAEHMTGSARYKDAAHELIEKHSYATNTVDQKVVWPVREVNHSDDELAFLAYYPLLWYERDPELRKYYLTSIERSWQIERPERSPLFNFIYAAARQANTWTDPTKRPEAARVEPGDYDRDELTEWFREVPADTIKWRVTNSDRQDLGDLVTNRFRQRRTRHVLPVSERHIMRWNGDPYELDGGGDGHERDDGTFILLPYWMGRYHRLID